MSALQLQTSSRIIEAMGPMIHDRQKVDQVIGFIIKLKNGFAPCQYTDDEMRMLLKEATEQTQKGQWITHEEMKKEVLSWH
ncbi:MAG: hypothetical protein MJZ64_00685 [Paludibacteraceae bacterium]|nr:hypothetical protein [Paludibacteraceae bacterium]